MKAAIPPLILGPLDIAEMGVKLLLTARLATKSTHISHQTAAFEARVPWRAIDRWSGRVDRR
jgi:hypothetical protein